MPKISALVHSTDDAPRIGRALDSLRVCDEVIVIGHGSAQACEKTEKVVREHGATWKAGIPGVDHGAYALETKNEWVLCITPFEALSEELEASVNEWKKSNHDDASGFRARVREECDGGWKTLDPETRLVNRARVNWTGDLPPNTSTFDLLRGDILRLSKP